MDAFSFVALTVAFSLLLALVLAAWLLGGIGLDVIRQRDEERREGR